MRKNRKFILTPAGEYFYKKSLVLNDRGRAFSDQYVNLILTVGNEYIEISSRNPIASLPSITLQELKNVPCILVASREQRENEQGYYQGVVGFQGDFLYAENLEEARLMVHKSLVTIVLSGREAIQGTT